MQKAVQLCNDYLDAYKKNYDSEKVKDEEKRRCDYKQFEIIDNRDQEPKSTKKEETQKNPDEIQKPSWIKLSRKDFESSIKDVADDLNNSKFKTSIYGKAYDFRNAKKFLVKITTQKTSEKEAHEIYFGLIAPDITALEKSKSMAKDKRSNILTVFKNLQSAFTVAYLNYSDKPPESEESIPERKKLRRQRN